MTLLFDLNSNQQRKKTLIYEPTATWYIFKMIIFVTASSAGWLDLLAVALNTAWLSHWRTTAFDHH